MKVLQCFFKLKFWKNKPKKKRKYVQLVLPMSS